MNNLVWAVLIKIQSEDGQMGTPEKLPKHVNAELGRQYLEDQSE